MKTACWLLAAALSGGAHADDEAKVWLRIRNSTNVAFAHVWQGAPHLGSAADFGPLIPGRTSDWRAFPAALPHYRKTAVQLADGRQLIHIVTTALGPGRNELAPGRYTFEYTLDHAALARGETHHAGLILRVIDEAATAAETRQPSDPDAAATQ